MDVQVAESGPCRRTLTIKVPPEQIRGHLQRAFDAASRQVRIKGFRAGKVPRQIVEKKYGEAIRAEAKERIINESFNDAIRQHELRIVGRPRFEAIDEAPVDAERPLEFTVQLDVRPEFELGEVRGLETDARPTEVSDEDVEAALRQLADQKKTLDAVDAPAEERDFVRARLVYRNAAGEEVHQREGAQLHADIPIAGTDPVTFRSELLGKEKGSSFSLDITFPEQFEVEPVRGQQGRVEIELLEVQRVQPAPIDDELAKAFGFDSLDALKDELRGRIGPEKLAAENARRENRLLETIAAAHPFELPESLVEEESQRALEDFRQRLARSGAAEAEVEQRVAAAREEALEDARRRVRMFFLIGAIAQKEDLRATEAEVEEEVIRAAAQNGVTAEQMRAYVREHDLIGQIRLGIVEKRVREFLREHATITDNPGEGS